MESDAEESSGSVEITEKPISYQDGDTQTQELTMGPGNDNGEKIIKVDDAIESIGFGKFQRRVLWVSSLFVGIFI